MFASYCLVIIQHDCRNSTLHTVPMYEKYIYLKRYSNLYLPALHFNAAYANIMYKLNLINIQSMCVDIKLYKLHSYSFFRDLDCRITHPYENVIALCKI